jgi:hypothetical protein
MIAARREENTAISSSGTAASTRPLLERRYAK